VGEVLTAEEVGQVLIFIAPGFFALAAYRYEFPAPPRDRWETLVISLAASVPLVALAEVARGLFGVNRNPLAPQYVGLLLGLSLAAGGGLARLRGSGKVRRALTRLGFQQEPESLVFLRTVPRMPQSDAQVTVTFKDGTILAGTPRFWSDPNSPVRELFLTNPAWYDADVENEGERWRRRDEGGVLLSLDEVWTIELESDPL
jgi:hypothetical protein